MKVSKELKYSVIKTFREMDKSHLINILTETSYPDEIDKLAFRVVGYHLNYKNEIIEPNLILDLKSNIIRVLNVYDEIAVDFNISIDINLINNSKQLFDIILFELDKNTTNMKVVEFNNIKLVKEGE